MPKAPEDKKPSGEHTTEPPGGGTAAQDTPAGAPQGARLSDAERQRRIAEVAYHKARERGFEGDRHLDDWLEAERELDRLEGRRP